MGSDAISFVMGGLNVAKQRTEEEKQQRIEELRRMQPIRFEGSGMVMQDTQANDGSFLPSVEEMQVAIEKAANQNGKFADAPKLYTDKRVIFGTANDNAGNRIIVGEDSELNSPIVRFANSLIQNYGSNANLPYRIKNMIIDASDMPESAKQAAKQRNNAKLMPTFALPQSDNFWDNAAEGAGTILGEIGKQATLGLATGGGSAAAGKVSDTVYNAMKGGKAADTAANAGKAARLWDRVARGTAKTAGSFVDNELYDIPNDILTGISKGKDAGEIADDLKTSALYNLAGGALLSGLPSALSKNPYRYYNGAEVIPTDADVEKWIQDNPDKVLKNKDDLFGITDESVENWVKNHPGEVARGRKALGIDEHTKSPSDDALQTITIDPSGETLTSSSANKIDGIWETLSVDPESNLPFDDALRINKTSQQTTAGEVSPKTTFYSKYKSENPMPDGKINGASASDFIDAMEKELPDNVLDLDDKIGEMEAMLEVADDADDVAGGATSYKKQLEARLYAARMKKAYMEAAENTASKSAKSVGNVNADTSVDAAPMSKEEFYNSYNSMARDIPRGKINFGGKTMSVAEYADMVDTNLPDTKPELESRISNLERIKRRISGRGGEARNGVHGSRNAAHQTKSTGSQTLPVNIQLFAEENVSQRYRSRGASQALEIDAQLYAAKRKLTYLELAQGEEGVVPRGFVQSILQKNTPLSTDEILEYLRQNPETYTVKADAVKFANADRLIDTDRKKVDLYNRVVSAKPGTLLLNDEEVEAVKKLAEEYLKQGDTQKSANLIIGLSRTGTEAGRALRSYGFKDLTSPEGVIRAADDAVRQGIDNKAFKGASDALDDFADKVRGKVESGAGKQAPGTADRVASVEGAIQDSIDERTDNRLRKLFKKKGNTRSMAERIVEAIDQGAFNNETLKSTFAESLGLPSLDEDTVSKLVELAKRAGEAVDYSQEQADIFEEIYETLAKKVPMTALEKFNSVRKIGMLSNIKTHAKNFFSNLAMMLTRKSDDAVANLLEKGLKQENRTRRLGWSFTEHGRNIRNVVDEATDRARMELQRVGKFDISNSSILRARDPFQSKILQPINKLSRLNSRLLEAEDSLFFTRAFRDNLGQIMTARGMDEVTDEVYDLAMKRGMEAVFRGKNGMSEVIDSLKHTKFKGVNTVVDVLMPFSETPSNILINSLQHSPFELGRVAADVFMNLRGKSNVEAAEIINKLSKAITGTGLFALGMYLGNSGLASSKFEYQGKRGKAEQIAGNQENALHIGDLSISFDWLQPAAVPVLAGVRFAEMDDVKDEEGKELSADQKVFEYADNLTSFLMSGMDTFFEQSFMQSLGEALAQERGERLSAATGALLSIPQQAVSQAIPTVVGQLARTIDPIQRQTKGDTDTQTAINKLLSKIPGASTMLEPQLDAFGREVRRSNADSWIENAFNQFVNPSNVSHALYTDDDAVQEMMRVFQATDDTRALPSIVESTEEKPLTVREITEEQKRVGAASKAALDELMNNERRIKLTENYTNAYGKEKQRTYLKYWNEMTDEEKVKVLARIFADAKQDPDKYIDDLMKGVN